jgi:hypothetical protein
MMTSPENCTGHIFFGLGAGRSGTASLAGLLNAQPGTVCFHEINPSAMAWQGAEDTVLSLLRDFRAILRGEERSVTIDRTSPNRNAPVARMKALRTVTGIGDVGHYYLPYVETILEREPQARFPCLWRDQEEVVQSFITKLKLNPHSRTARVQALLRRKLLPDSRNHWAGPEDTRWQEDKRFDACFPGYEGLETADLATHLRRWHEEYYAKVRRLAHRYPDHVRIFDLASLNDIRGRTDLLEFALPGADIESDVSVHVNASRTASHP